MSSTSTTNFALVDAAFGPQADLYTDVLGMDDGTTERTREGIAQAYAVRRATMLAQLEQEDSTASSREAVQEQLDALVWTVRFLNHSKAAYDASPRCKQQASPAKGHKGYFRRSKKTTPSSSMDDEDENENIHPQNSKHRSSSKKKKKKEQQQQAQDSPSRVHWGNKEHDSTFAVHTATEMPSVSYYTADATTVHTGGDETMDSTLILKDMDDDDNDDNLLSSCCADQSRMLRKVQREIAGACDDALTSFDQVFHAFTLTDQDISAVTKKIDRAKKQALAAED